MIIKTSNKKDYYNNSKLRDLSKFKSHKKPCKDTSNNDNKYINNKEEVNPIEVYQNNIYSMPGIMGV
ncbi:hypothetical protein JQ032_07415 [Clostridium botulinum]|nr:hypothetical protein [Clostridium botulinum]MCS4480110.1 hypothetical protein [Clostridium botulinum]